MKVTYKYRIPFMEISHVVMPKGSKILRIDGVDGGIYLWAIVDTGAPLVERTFHLYKTGGEMPENIGDYNYLGCGAIFIQMELMMYVFEYPDSEIPASPEPEPFDWKKVQDES